MYKELSYYNESRLMTMDKKGKIIIAVAVTATALAVGTAVTTVVLCRRIYEKHYFTVSD